MAKTANPKKQTDSSKITSTVAKSEDGTIQITFTLPIDLILKTEDQVLLDIAKDATVAGFRKGKAPVDQVKKNTSESKVIERILAKILPKAFGEAVEEHKLKPSMYPKFDLVSGGEKDWQVRATTCEIADFELGDYKKIIKDAAGGPTIVVPGQEEKNQKSREEKEQKALEALHQNIKIIIPKVLTDEEVNVRLSQLLERIEKLGLTLEGYLQSINKTSDALRAEYEAQTTSSIKLELILNKIADLEKVDIKDSVLEEALKATAADPVMKNKLDNPEQRRMIRSILRRRTVLDLLIGGL